jgi:hypothetical protein
MTGYVYNKRKISSMIFKLHLDTSYYGPPHPFAGVAADSLIVMSNAMMKCLFIVTMSCIHRGLGRPHR